MKKHYTESVKLLSNKINQSVKDKNIIILGFLGKGEEFARSVAESTGFVFDLVACHKIGHPDNKSYTIGYIELRSRDINWKSYVTRDYVDKETETIRSRILKEYEKVMGKNQPLVLLNKKVVLVVNEEVHLNHLDCILTLLKSQKPSKISLAGISADSSQLLGLKHFVDEFVFLNITDCY